MKPRLHISEYFQDGTPDDLGETVRFRVQNPVRGVILQQVHHRTKRAGHKTVTREFYECWTVSKSGRIKPAPTDSFFVPCSYTKSAGRIDVRAKAWFLPCDPIQLKKLLSLEDADNAVSGVLPSQNGHLPHKYVRKGYNRHWRASLPQKRDGMCLTVTSTTNAD